MSNLGCGEGKEVAMRIGWSEPPFFVSEMSNELITFTYYINSYGSKGLSHIWEVESRVMGKGAFRVTQHDSHTNEWIGTHLRDDIHRPDPSVPAGTKE